jgi:predicted dehydrogenase
MLQRFQGFVANVLSPAIAGWRVRIGEPVIFKSIGRDADAPPSYFAGPLNGILSLDSSIQEFDLGRWLMRDKMVGVHAFAGLRALPELAKYRRLDSGVLNPRFSRGVIDNVESFIYARYGHDIRTVIVGTKGTFMVGSLRSPALEVLKEAGSGRDMVRHFLAWFADADLAEMCDFVESVLNSRPPRTSALTAAVSRSPFRSQRVSYREGRPTRL